MSGGIVFNVDTGRVLQILAKEIYDSPLAMLRENVQNAYDAVRERFAPHGTLNEGGRIDLTVAGLDVAISDNGVGMTEKVLRENFWNAGSSGKRTERARSAGVVGTFGIGAMANFGVCTELTVETRALEDGTGIRSTALRDNLRIGEECITFERSDARNEPGTTVRARLDPANAITADQAIVYLRPYVGMLPVPVFVNDVLISQTSLTDSLPTQGRTFGSLGIKAANDAMFAATIEVFTDSNGQIMAEVTKLRLADAEIEGSLSLLQGSGPLMGLRSYFGLAAAPVGGSYQLGGFANLAILVPTAGRDALSRESIDHLNRIVALVEKTASELLAPTAYADRSNAFLSWIAGHSRYDLADRVTVSVQPGDQTLEFGAVRELRKEKTAHYYVGNDKTIVGTFANETSILLLISPNNPLRKVQLQLALALRIPQVPDSAQIVRTYDGSDLNAAEAAVLFRAVSILREDYLLSNVNAAMADISHGVTILASDSNGQVMIHLARSSPSIAPLVECYYKAYELFNQFMKDYVRVNIYPRVQQYVPTSTKGGVDALRDLLMKSRELYRYEESERGDLEGLLGDYLSGSVPFDRVLSKARTTVRAHSQRVSAEQVGTIERELPELAQSPVQPSIESQEDLTAQPPITLDAISSSMKILTTSTKYPLLNSFTMFLGVSDRLMNTEADFLRRPHTTRVIWAGHRVVYIFTEDAGRLSLYYDIELKNPLVAEKTGGGLFRTTTLITKSRIFIPIPEVLRDEFEVAGGPREFFVRFDILTGDAPIV